jgi:uncharacterized protein YodC (DUF2158 family)
MTFKVGDVVVLNSGGPEMTVEALSGDRVVCCWFNNGKNERAQFALAMLKAPAAKAAPRGPKFRLATTRKGL